MNACDSKEMLSGDRYETWEIPECPDISFCRYKRGCLCLGDIMEEWDGTYRRNEMLEEMIRTCRMSLFAEEYDLKKKKEREMPRDAHKKRGLT
jgi:hypothetical protein